MNILIVNQPVNNRGDESAHKALVRNLLRDCSNVNIKVQFFGVKNESIEQMRVHDKSVVYLNDNYHKYFYLIIKFSIKYHFLWLLILVHPLVRKYSKILKNVDIVMCAPGGVCLGIFQDWRHLFWLKVAQFKKKRIFYFGRSIGPFTEKDRWSKEFKKQAVQLLKNVEFLSLRDNESFILAEELELNFEKTIDSAFLGSPDKNSPKSVNLEQMPYLVYVPNSLTWHKYFSAFDSEKIFRFNRKIAEFLLRKYEDLNLVMLPQLFSSSIDDFNYFKKIKESIGSERITVISDLYSSDVQQQIISQSKGVVGARYHSIVFAINNAVPFWALSYEKKMDGLLSLVDLHDRKTNIFIDFNSRYEIDHLLSSFEHEFHLETTGISEARIKAKEIAKMGFFKMLQKINLE